VKGIPLVGGGVGAGVNVVSLNQIAKYAKVTFTPIGDGDEAVTGGRVVYDTL
jgi:hypothetical protein